MKNKSTYGALLANSVEILKVEGSTNQGKMLVEILNQQPNPDEFQLKKEKPSDRNYYLYFANQKLTRFTKKAFCQLSIYLSKVITNVKQQPIQFEFQPLEQRYSTPHSFRTSSQILHQQGISITSSREIVPQRSPCSTQILFEGYPPQPRIYNELLCRLEILSGLSTTVSENNVFEKLEEFDQHLKRRVATGQAEIERGFGELGTLTIGIANLQRSQLEIALGQRELRIGVEQLDRHLSDLGIISEGQDRCLEQIFEEQREIETGQLLIAAEQHNLTRSQSTTRATIADFGQRLRDISQLCEQQQILTKEQREDLEIKLSPLIDP